jgi:RNase P subunit RPR2
MGSFYTKNNSGAILLANQDITAATGTAEAAFGEHQQQRTIRLHPHRKSSAHRVTSLQKVMANKLPSKLKENLCTSCSRRFLPISTMLAEARSASFSSSSLWFYCFAARFERLEKMNPFNHH